MRKQIRLKAIAGLAAAAALGLASPLWGQTDSSGTFKTGDELYAVCTSADDADVADCDWYVMGVHDAVILHQDLDWVEKVICVPNGTDASAVRAKVVEYLQGSSDRTFTAVSMVYNALEQGYPC